MSPHPAKPLGFCLVACSVVLLTAWDDPTPVEFEETETTIKSRGQDFRVDLFSPKSSGRHPAVIVLHGHGGLGEGKHSGCHEQARRLAEAGYVAAVPHYFGNTRPDPKNGRKNARSFAGWVRTVSDTISHVARRPDVDPKHIGLVGFSLGSYVSLSVGARDRRVAAVVENFGGIPQHESLNWSRLPPVLILHGDDDKIVSVDEAHRLDELLDQAGVTHEIKIYPGAGHGFRGEDHTDAAGRTLSFLDKHLKTKNQPQVDAP